MPSPWPVDPLEPRRDERTPTFCKGQWFGGVPHSRVVIIDPSAKGRLSSLAGGILLTQSGEDFTFPNEGFAEWRGILNDTNGQWTCRYRWSVASATEGTCNFLFTMFHFEEEWEVIGALQVPRPNLATGKVLITSEVNPVGDAGASVTKHDVPEWANPLGRWPDLMTTDVF